MDEQKKILTRIQLINWHFFENERISINGSTLISGENTAGKSTILDAIQLVLTTNTRKFNVAANEKGNRDLRGYVRCKIGNVGETYLRKNVVPANVALEFYEEKGDRYFVIGVHMTSQDEESTVSTKWYVEECRLENLSFIVDNRAALSEEFKVDGKKIRYMDQKNMAKDRFKKRLGNLEDKFFDIIPKSLAFKPMDNVKEFINKFVLSEEKIDVASLRENIETLTELEALLVRCEKQYKALKDILDIYQNIEKKDYDLAVNEILLLFAGYDAVKQEIEELDKEVRINTLSVNSDEEEAVSLKDRLKTISEQILGINVAIQNNSSAKLVEDIRKRIENREEEIKNKRNEVLGLNEQTRALKEYEKVLRKIERGFISSEELELLSSEKVVTEKKSTVEKIEKYQLEMFPSIQREAYKLQGDRDVLDNEITALQEKLKQLEKRSLQYPDNTVELKKKIEREFVRRGFNTKVYILAELLEITDAVWINAIEGYLNSQRFYLVVEPEYYDIALEIYDKEKETIHTAGIINTKKIPLDISVDFKSLAYVVKSENRYAKAYADYILGRVFRCDTVKELEDYDIGVTAGCMLYQGYVVRHINPAIYKNPYIGSNAYRTQIVNTKNELDVKSAERKQLREKIQVYNDVTEAESKVNLELLKLRLNAPFVVKDLQEQQKQDNLELKKASNDPTLIQLQFELDNANKQKEKIETEYDNLNKSIVSLKLKVEQQVKAISEKRETVSLEKKKLENKQDSNGAAFQDANDKYVINRKSKSAKDIAKNFEPQKSRFENEKNELMDQLKEAQIHYNSDFTQDLIIGLTGISEYREQAHKLQTVEMIQYEEKLRKAKEDCEQIFRSDFLSKMKEHIENARVEFKSLNKALDNIYYGEDSYHFKVTFDKKKEGLYKMITSENNQEGYNLWTAAFEEEYKEEMKDLFDKLMTKDDNGAKIVEEYTDYRTYLDYDIEIHKKNGSVQRFSDIYGEKSGSETQVPYYVAIAASFYQLYRFGNSVRLMLLDEAFDKMDDERIGSMLDFFNGLNLQVIMATPPSKIETIGEKIDTVLACIRVGQNSIVEEYDM